MRNIKAALEKIPVLDGVLSFLERTGVGTIIWFVIAGIWSLVVTVWAWVYSHTPPWGLAMIFTGILSISVLLVSKGMGAWRDFNIAKAMTRFDPTKHVEFGMELVGLSEEIFRFLADRQREISSFHQALPEGRASFDLWQADRDFELVTGKLFFEKFGSRVLGSAALLHSLGIRMPSHMVVLSHSRPNGIPQFLGVMGELLKHGNIEQAVVISNDRDFMWQIGH